MTETVSMDANGCVALPQDVRDALRLAAPASLRLAVKEGRIELTPITEKLSPSPNLKWKNGLLVVKATGEPFETDLAIREVRESRM
jgi:bifunctional DNA-binding transcriptional regulator/antitoxin component of YhaV-PrlF toxin-antitoxin module